jgi:hypothetical protein
MATVPTVLDATAGVKITASAFDAGVKLPLDWLLANYPRVHASDSSSASMTNGTATLVPLNAETFDTDAMHDTVTNNSRIIHTTAGLYDESWLITIAGGVAYTQLDLQIRLNAAGSSAGGTSLRTQSYSDGTRSGITMYFHYQRFFSAADYTEAFITQASGGARALSATTLGTRCMSRWIASS